MDKKYLNALWTNTQNLEKNINPETNTHTQVRIKIYSEANIHRYREEYISREENTNR